MRRSSLFGHTAELLDQIRSSSQPVDNAVREFYRKRHYLGSRDRRFISEYLYGILRHHDRLTFLLKQAIDEIRPGVRLGRLPAIGLCAAYAMIVMGESPETVLPDVGGLWRTETTDMDPAVLLRVLSGAKIPEAILAEPVRNLALRESMPEFIAREWVDRFGVAEAEALCQASNRPAATALRVNRLMTDPEACLQALASEGVPARRGVLAPDALVLEKRAHFPSLRAFREGWLEVQDEGSQLISLLLQPRPGDRIVDACAGGGGKTLHLAALMANQGTILSLDVSEQKLKNLKMRVQRAHVSIADIRLAPLRAEQFSVWGEKADGVLVDAPCSGVGTLRRNPGAKLRVSEQFVHSLVSTQREILREAAAFVRPGGRLVYSTCSLLTSENEQIVEGFLSGREDFRQVSAPRILQAAGVPVEDNAPALTLFPHRHPTDGYFAAVMERRADR
jgi:16S rRNA (cytosine967-C5)-methyltransferase